MLKQAFNAVIRLNSRTAFLKRIEDPELTSPIRIAPANYFTKIGAPSAIIAQGREFIIPVDSIVGTRTVLISFSVEPTSGSFTIALGSQISASFDETATSADIQTELRTKTGMSKIGVEGNYADGFLISFYGVVIGFPTVSVGNSLNGPSTVAITVGSPIYVPWSGRKIQRGDRIVDSVHGSMAIDIIEDMTDLGGDVMGFRARCG